VLEVFCMPWILFGILCCRLSSYVLIWEKWEKTNEETMRVFPPFGSPSTSYCVYQNIDGVYWVWGRLIFQRAQAPAVNYPKASVPRAPLHSRIWTCKLNNRVGVSIWFSPLHLYVSMKARLVVIRVQPCIGVSMKARFVVIRVQPCFDLGLLGTLGQVWVSLGTSQVHNICFVWV